MMQFKRFGSRNQVVFSPTLCGSVATTGEESMQHGQINCPFDVKVVAASFQQRSNDILDAALLPEPPKDQLRPGPQHPHSFGLPCGMRIDEGEMLSMAPARTDQRPQPSPVLDAIATAL